MDESLTRYSAVETIWEGKKYPEFLKENKGNYDGVIVCMPNFGDKNGASVARKVCLVQCFKTDADSIFID